MKVIPSIKIHSLPPDPRTHVLSPLVHEDPTSYPLEYFKSFSLMTVSLVNPIQSQPPDPQTTVFSSLAHLIPSPCFFNTIKN